MGQLILSRWTKLMLATVGAMAMSLSAATGSPVSQPESGGTSFLSGVESDHQARSSDASARGDGRAFARGRKFRVCRDGYGHCAVVRDTTYRGKYRCKAWAYKDLLRFKCRVKDTRVDGTGVYVAIKDYGTPFDNPNGWYRGSGYVGPKGTVRWYHSAGAWQSPLNIPGQNELDFWRFHLCRHDKGGDDICSGRDEIAP